jgi:hypothetical protein
VELQTVRFLSFVAWGVSSTVVWGLVLYHAYQSWTQHRDRRSLREVMSVAALFVTAAGSTVAVLAVLFGDPGGTPRQFALALALGMFLGAGLVMLGMRKGED